MQLDAGDVRSGAEVGVSHDVKVGKAGEAEGFGDAAATGGLEVEEEVGGKTGVALDLVPGEEGADEGGLVFAAGEQRVRLLVGGVEGGMRLKDDIGLTGEEPACGVRMRKDGHRDLDGLFGSDGLRGFLSEAANGSEQRGGKDEGAGHHVYGIRSGCPK